MSKNNIKYAILGYGNRGNVYGEKLHHNGKDVVAVCDTLDYKLERAKKYYQNAEYFDDENEFFAKKRADVLIIATMDQLHYRQTLKAIELGYNILLEKPISINLQDCEEIAQKANEKNVKVLVCHVLRYTYFYSAIKKLLDDNTIGQVVSIEAAENVNLGHYISSFVRGRWNNAENSTPIIVQKCCHDFDIIYWLMNDKCVSVSSFGGLTYFNQNNKPTDSADYCVDCKIKDCLYNSIDLYTKYPSSLDAYDFEQTPEGVKKLLSDKGNPYSRCIFKTNNNVMDHQIVNMLFEKGGTAQLSMTAFNQDGGRTIKIHGTLGTVEGKLEDGKIYVRLYDKEFGVKDYDKVIDVNKGDYASHSGGDDNIVKDIIEYFEDEKSNVNVSDVNDALMSHKMAFCSEESRIENGRNIKL